MVSYKSAEYHTVLSTIPSDIIYVNLNIYRTIFAFCTCTQMLETLVRFKIPTKLPANTIKIYLSRVRMLLIKTNNIISLSRNNYTRNINKLNSKYLAQYSSKHSV